MKTCPFKNEICNDECSLFISVNDLNELVVSKLRSLGVLTQDSGICSLKIASLSAARYIFENTITKRM